MNASGLKIYARRTYPALALEKIISRRARRWWRGITELAVVILAVLLVLALARPDWDWPARKLLGGEMLLAALWLKLLVLETFFLTAYFRHGSALIDFETAQLINQLSARDVTGSFLATELGKEMMLRAGVSAPALQEFLRARVSRVALAQLMVTPKVAGEMITLADFARALYQTDKDFGRFLFQNEVQEVDFTATAEWLTRATAQRKLHERWWGREALGRVPGLAKDWSYGRAATLKRYAEPVPASTEQEYNYNRDETEKIEAVLAREREDNVMLVGDDAARKSAIIGLLAKMIETGEVLPPLEHKEIVMLGAAAFSAGNPAKSGFESEFIKALNDAARAGNIIAVFPEFTTLARSAETLGSNLVTLIEPYLVSPNLQIIALCSTDEFHRVWESKGELMQRFEKIILPEVASEATMRILEDEAVAIERRRPVRFTRPALKTIAEGAERYFAGGVMPDAAIDLMFDLSSSVKSSLITKADVEAVIKAKTGIPVGAISGDERAKLANLEQILHQRIIGQDEAIAGVAGALRRARAGTNNPDRPIGSFLFLGPTGVGKTETTKALAHAYFSDAGGDEKIINRLDMSEYSSPDSLDRLMSILADKLREQPYGILLLDEFEKATAKVHNLFLQILDEGWFSDLAGKRVVVRNQMIIATSNAASDLIWEAMKSGQNLLDEKSNIVDELIKRDIFKPELLNRFDGVILFHPLASEHLKKVARILLDKLIERLKARGTLVEVADDLIDYLAEQGTDPKFGARSMNRAIQDNIEQVVANKIILENLPPGQTIRLTKADML